MTKYLLQRTLFEPIIQTQPSSKLNLIVVIPCYNEQNLLKSLDSLRNADLPKSHVEVIIVINNAIDCSQNIIKQNKITLNDALEYAEKYNSDSLRFYPIYKGVLAKKHAGVGLARKIGMDEAAYRLEKIGNPNGVIVCFDADSQCDKNYLVEIEKHFDQNPKTPACSIHYEHPINGDAFSKEIYDAIIDYELHLRYYVHIQRWIGFPFAYQTIGSSMAVRCNAYQQQGGMNKRKAGEDFYFLHKFTHFSDFTELKTTKVIPSPRISNRVPFGTGKAVGEIINNEEELATYHPQSFLILKPFLEIVAQLYIKDLNQFKLNKVVIDFLNTVQFEQKLHEIRSNSASENSFVKRFFQWFDAFMMMKYVHYAREYGYPNISISEASSWLIDQLDCHTAITSKVEMLAYFRMLDQG